MFRERKYRIGFIPFFLAMMVVSAAVVGALRLGGWRLHDSALGPGELTLFLALGGLAVVCWAFFPVYVGPQGLRATDGIGRFHEVPWDAIRSVRSFSGFLWIDYGKPGKGLCFPKSLNDSFGFREYVRRNSPEGNPLRTYLLNR